MRERVAKSFICRHDDVVVDEDTLSSKPDTNHPMNPPRIVTQPQITSETENQKRTRLKKRNALLAIILVLVIGVGFVGAVIFSNILTLGPYTAGQQAITVSQVDAPRDITACNSNSSYVNAQALPPSGSVVVGPWYRTGIRLQSSMGVSVNIVVVYNITYTGSGTPNSGTFRLAFCDGSHWNDLHPTFNPATNSWQGNFGPPGGFPVTSSYDQTTPILATFLLDGTYTAKVWAQSA